MERRTFLEAAACATVPLSGCLTDGGGEPTYTGAVEEIYEVYEGGIPRGVGPDQYPNDRERWAFLVRSRDEGSRMFSNEDVTEERRAENERFLERTDFDAQVLLQIEEMVPNSAYDLSIEAVSLDGETLSISYEENSLEGETALAAEQLERTMLRVDVQEAGIASFDISFGDESFSPVESDTIGQ